MSPGVGTFGLGTFWFVILITVPDAERAVINSRQTRTAQHTALADQRASVSVPIR
jgi:hypothetical protein